MHCLTKKFPQWVTKYFTVVQLTTERKLWPVNPHLTCSRHEKDSPSPLTKDQEALFRHRQRYWFCYLEQEIHRIIQKFCCCCKLFLCEIRHFLFVHNLNWKNYGLSETSQYTSYNQRSLFSNTDIAARGGARKSHNVDVGFRQFWSIRFFFLHVLPCPAKSK